jgi:hypothetical protein
VLTFLNQVFKRPVYAKIGTIEQPEALNQYPNSGTGIFIILNNIMKLMIVGAGLFALFNFITAGYQFISAGGNTEKINEAWNKIWQSMLGVLIAAGSFIIAGVIGKLIFGDWTAITSPTITGP